MRRRWDSHISEGQPDHRPAERDPGKSQASARLLWGRNRGAWCRVPGSRCSPEATWHLLTRSQRCQALWVHVRRSPFPNLRRNQGWQGEGAGRRPALLVSWGVDLAVLAKGGSEAVRVWSSEGFRGARGPDQWGHPVSWRPGWQGSQPAGVDDCVPSAPGAPFSPAKHSLSGISAHTAFSPPMFIPAILPAAGLLFMTHCRGPSA